MVPYLWPSGQAMVDFKLRLQSDLLKVTKSLTTRRCSFCFFFVFDHTTKLGMKDLLQALQW